MKKFLIIFLFFLTTSLLFSSILVKLSEPLSIPIYRTFKENSEFIKSLHEKKITAAEYLTDPIIMYASLWGCIGLTLPLWEPQFTVTQTNTEYINRLKMEPFASDRIDPVTKPLLDSNGNPVKDYFGNAVSVLKGDFYAKNFIEPIYFTGLTLYMRSKNYHPALMIGEIFSLAFMYEFTIRPFFLNASFEQLLKNPAVGVVIGILLDELSTFLLTTPYIGLHVLAYFINPFNALPVSRIHPLLLFDAFRKVASIQAIVNL